MERQASFSSQSGLSRSDSDRKPKRQKARCDGAHPCGTCKSASRGADDCVFPPSQAKIEPSYLEELEAKARELETLQRQLREQRYVPPTANGGASTSSNTLAPMRHVPAPPTLRSTTGSPAKAMYAKTPSETVPPGFEMVHRMSVVPLSIANATHGNAVGAPPDSAPPVSGAGEVEDPITLVSTHDPAGRWRESMSAVVQEAASRLNGEQLPRLREPIRPPLRRTNSQSKSFIFSHSSDPSDLFCLPTKAVADELVGIYFKHLHKAMPVLHWDTFHSRYLALWSGGLEIIDTHLFGVLNQIFAIACQLAPADILPDNECCYQAGMRYYKRSVRVCCSAQVLTLLKLKLMYPLVLSSEDLASLQTLLLMAHGLHLATAVAGLSPIEAEIRRRLWASCILLEAICSSTLGLPPSLTKHDVVLPTEVEDQYLNEHNAFQPRDQPSTGTFFVESVRLFGIIQLRAVQDLYAKRDSLSVEWPDVQAVLELESECLRFTECLPYHLSETPEGSRLRGGQQELLIQTNAIHARIALVVRDRRAAIELISQRLTVHRPMLFYLCAHSTAFPADPNVRQPNKLDMHVALGSARIGVDAAIDMIQRGHHHWKTWKTCCYWFKLGYVHMGSLTILAALIVDTNKALQDAPFERIVGPNRADAALEMAIEFLQAMSTPGHPSVPPAATAGPARKTAVKSLKMINSIRSAIRSPSPAPQVNGTNGASVPPHHLGSPVNHADAAQAGFGGFVLDAADLSMRAYMQMATGSPAFTAPDAGFGQPFNPHDVRTWNGLQMLNSTSLPTSYPDRGVNADQMYIHQPQATDFAPPIQNAPSFFHLRPPRPGIDYQPAPSYPTHQFAPWPTQQQYEQR